MPAPDADLKTVMVTCYKCGWSFSTKKKECPMCGAHIVIGEKELVRILGEYIERQGLYATKKNCEKFVKTFKKKKKRLPTLDELWNAAVSYRKMQTLEFVSEDKKKGKKKKSKGEEELEKKIAEIRKKKLEEKLKKKEKKEEKAPKEEVKVTPPSAPARPSVSSASVSSSPVSGAGTSSTAAMSREERLRALREKIMAARRQTAAESTGSDSGASGGDYIICPVCGTRNPPGSKFCMEDGTPLG